MSVHKVLQSIIRTAGPNGLRGLQSSIRMDHEFVLCPDDLRIAFKNYGIHVREADFNELVALFCTETGAVHVAALFAALRAFATLDPSGRGLVDLDVLHTRFNPSQHPEVVSGQRTIQEVSFDFRDIFDDVSNPSGLVTWQEFEAYYAGVSAGIEHDTYFELMMANCWGLDDLHLEAIVRDQAFGDSQRDFRSTLPPGSVAKLNYRKPQVPRRIVGYTGHVPGAKDSFGVTFDVSERAAPSFGSAAPLSPPPPGVADLRKAQFPKNSLRVSINAHSYKLE
eukprot:GGOE01044409.1.p1 GENE.GGOE01044409.1~~GGOE01044409.1.p1  ORF type:complete len:280 (+),score=58.18 GGOE01044409.1:60-899(+)